MNELLYLFRGAQRVRPVLLLGAGASFRSGIPLAAPMVQNIAKAAFARNVKGMDWRNIQIQPTDWRPYLQKQPWFIGDPDRLSDNYPLAVQNLLVPRDFRREFLEDAIIPPNGVNEGYRHLGELVRRGLCWTVLTTNFDHLIVEGMRTLNAPVRDVLEINKTKDDWVRFNLQNRKQVIYLHGAAEYYTDKNLEDEIQRFDNDLVNRIRPLLAESPLVVIGYRGSEMSVMKHLLLEGAKTCNRFPQGVFWCIRKGETPHENVLALGNAIGTNLRLVQIDGFDETLEFLNESLAEEALYLQGETNAAASKTESFDGCLMPEKSMSDLDMDLVTSVVHKYCERLQMPKPAADRIVSFLLELGLVEKHEDELRPTRACFLLFGTDLSKEFPYAATLITRNEKKRTVFTENLITQYANITALLTSDEVNPSLRLKKEFTSEESFAYSNRAISEIVVNMLVHRDYSATEFNKIDVHTGDCLRFTSPGGLPKAIFNRVRRHGDGRFDPVRNLSEVRNEKIADIFCGIGPMDKVGSGLADVKDLMQENSGDAKFAILGDNEQVQVNLLQPKQLGTRNTATARPITRKQVFATNLLPFSVLPSTIFALPLVNRPKGSRLFTAADDPRTLPVFITHDECLYSFANWNGYSEFAGRCGDLDRIRDMTTSEFNYSDQFLLSWLLGKHWTFFLEEFHAEGLYVPPKKKQAYFCLRNGELENAIKYDSVARRGVVRRVVKRRQIGEQVEHENEGIYFSIERFGSEWTVQIKPMYVFTKADGQTPIPSWRTSKKATKRFKFDRNKNVDDDLSFWSRFLGGGKTLKNIGGPGVSDLIVSFDFYTAEVPGTQQEISQYASKG